MNTSNLRDCNTNPWYILMTLYGEYEDSFIDWDKAGANRSVWNSWALRGMNDNQKQDAILHTGTNPEQNALADEDLPELEKRFSEVWIARNGNGLPVPSLPNPKYEVDLSGTEFRKPLVLSSLFFGKADFSSSMFRGDLDLSGCFFDEVNFSGSRFENEAKFATCSFQCAFFQNTTFDHAASFGACTWRELCKFDEAKFQRSALFIDSAFGPRTSFHAALFHGLAHFTDSIFQTTSRMPVPEYDFGDAIFGGATSFRNVSFEARLPILDGASLNEVTSVSTRSSDWPKRPKWFDVFDTTYRKWTNYEHKLAKSSAATLRHAMARQSLPEEEHFFFRKEMFHAQRAEPWWKVLHIEMFDVLSEYGYSITRPVFWLAVVWALGVWAYATSTQFTWNLMTSAGYSFAAMFKFFGFQGTYLAEETAALGPGYELFAACQTVAGFVLLFFLGLGLRTRFRLR